MTIVTDQVTELPSAREISLTTSVGDGSPGGRVDWARFQCHRPTKRLLSAPAVLAASATQTPMMTVVPRIRVIASSPLVQVCEETPHAELVLSCDDYRRHVRYRRQRFSQEFVMARSAATTRPARTTSSLVQSERSEERRVGKECRSGW